MQSPEIIDVTVAAPIELAAEIVAEPKINIEVPPITSETPSNSPPKVSALSIASIRAQRELKEASKNFVKETVHLPAEAFSENDMLLQWNKYAQRLGDNGHKIMESLLLINDPVLNGTSISLELPNEGSKIDFETEMNGLLGHLKSHLHNHEITITIVVNEKLQAKIAFTDQDKYNRLHEINPAIELLRSTFGLDFME
ncbi:MAG TPA: hypothetical protein VK476_06440 [Flavobacterium sp.]|nr:hypothetical protein [Flavobacterium sp.]